MTLSAHDDDNKANIIEHFGSRLFQVFSYFFFQVEFKKDEKLLEEFIKNPGPDIRGMGIWIIQGACLVTTLLAIRNLDDFFKPRAHESRKDDIKASDLGYNESLEFLTKSERERINKIIMHSTDLAVKNWSSSWDIQELASKCVSQSLHFLDWVKTNHSPETHSEVLKAAIKYTALTGMILKYAEKFRAKNQG